VDGLKTFPPKKTPFSARFKTPFMKKKGKIGPLMNYGDRFYAILDRHRAFLAHFLFFSPQIF
jgi:hypothetical protein